MAKAALKASVARSTVASQKIGANDADASIARDALIELGAKVRRLEGETIAAQQAEKATKADSMILFAEHATAGFITKAGFDEAFLLFRYGEKHGKTQADAKDKFMSSHFRSIVHAAIDQASLGNDFVAAIKGIPATVDAMRKAAKADKNAPKPKQADQAIYTLANLAKNKTVKDVAVAAKPVNDTLIKSAIVTTKAVKIVADPITAALDNMLAAVALFIDPAAAAKAQVTLPAKEWRTRFVEVSNLIASFKADMIEDDEEDEAGE